MQPLLLGIDIGTSACKVALFTSDGAVAAQASGEYAVLHPQSGWAEQNPDDWWSAVCGALRQMLKASATDPRRIVGIGVDGQSWSAIPIDADGNTLCNNPIWFDTRAGDICTDLNRRFGEEMFYRMGGNPLQPAYSLPKVLWYQKHRPAVYEKADKILSSNGYIVYRLTGSVTLDLSQGYGFHCFDMRRGCWDEAMIADIGLRRDLLPEIAACHQIVGKVSDVAARQTGLLPGIPVVAGGLDAACGTLGAGVLHPGETQEQGGQAGGMSICLDECRTDPRLIMSFHVVPDRWLLQGGTVGGGGVMRWFEQEFGAAEQQVAARNGTGTLYEMDMAAAEISPGSDGLVFLPYMAGERSPIWDPAAKGIYYGLDYAKTRAHMIRASLEGVAFSLRHNLEIARQAGAPTGRLRAMGGAANSRLWTQIKSDVTGLPIDVPSSDTATTLGAVILAGVATGVWPDFETAIGTTVKDTRSHTPNPDNKPVYDRGFETYLELYQQLQPIMRKGLEQ